MGINKLECAIGLFQLIGDWLVGSDRSEALGERLGQHDFF